MQDAPPPADSIFASVLHNAEGHFLLHFFAVIARLLANLSTVEVGRQHVEQIPFLADYQAKLRTYLPSGLSSAMEETWWEAQLAQWEAQTSEYLPLRALVDEVGLNMHEVRMLIAAGLVEEDIRFGVLFASLQEPLTTRRPCIGVLSWLLSEPGDTPADAWQACRTLLDLGLLQVENSADPRAEWILRVPAAIWDALQGHPARKSAPGLTLQVSSDFPSLDNLILPETLHTRSSHLSELLENGQVKALIVRGMSGSGRRSMLGAIARTLKKNVLLWEGDKSGDDTWRLLGPLATLVGAIPVLRFDPAPGETLDMPALPGYAGPVGITLGHSGGLRGPLIAHSLSITLPPPDRNARRCFWQATQVPILPASLDDVTASFLLTGGNIYKAATLAQAYAVLDNRSEIIVPDVQQATRALNRQALETLATPLEPTNGWSDLIVSPAIAQELHTFEARCRHREALREYIGPALSHSLTRGVRALFTGPSGTGKTLAARALASALQMDLYRVDLAAVVNKYIGETERNLNQVFSRAEELDVVLLLDEGDALMTNRTDVRNANDRYANLETNYLLQRLETYEGIVVITTNAGSRIDSAFLRRIDFIIDFVPPEAAERWLIWQSHLPQSHSVSPAFLEEAARRCALTGGQIRNAALHAALLALGNSGQLGDAEIETAVQREYRKAGVTCPLRPKPAVRGRADRS